MKDTHVVPGMRDIHEMCEACALGVNGNWPFSSAVSRARWRLSFDRRWPSSSYRPCRPIGDTCAAHAASRRPKHEDGAHARSTRPRSPRSSRWSRWSHWSRWSRQRPQSRTRGRPKRPPISLTRHHPNRGYTAIATWITNRFLCTYRNCYVKNKIVVLYNLSTKVFIDTCRFEWFSYLQW